MNLQELETVKRLGLPIKMFIWNNDGYASIRSMQRNTFEGHYVASGRSSGLQMPDICKVAAAYEIPVFRMADNTEAEQILSEVLNTEGPVLCEVIISPEETVSPRTKSFRLPDGRMQSSLLEEMWPPVDCEQ